jgi:hypothetical protein
MVFLHPWSRRATVTLTMRHHAMGFLTTKGVRLPLTANRFVFFALLAGGLKNEATGGGCRP